MDNKDSSDNDDDDVVVEPAFPRSINQENLLKSSIFIGAILGQTTMGYLGDLIGRRKALLFTTVLAFCGSLFSAVLTLGPNLYEWLIFYRFILGVGVGGKYPLASTSRAENCGGGDEAADKVAAERKMAKEVAKSFFWQTPGSIAPYIVALIIVLACGEEKVGLEYYDTVNFQFRLLLGVGALPGAFVIFFSVLEFRALPPEVEEETEDDIDDPEQDEQQPPSIDAADVDRISLIKNKKPRPRNGKRKKRDGPWEIAKKHPEVWKVLVGTGMTWAIYDFIYYGTAMNLPSIVHDIFGSSESLVQNCYHNLLLGMMGLPGVLSAINQLEHLGTKRLMAYGFIFLSLISFSLALAMEVGDWKWLNFGFTALLIFGLNWGCNVATYVLPVQAFPIQIRSTFYGLSSSMGKTGAFLGGYFFTPISDAYGFSSVYAICGCVSLLGLMVTHYYIDPFKSGTLLKVKEKVKEKERGLSRC
jgi:PHS family inorganic phosphate transporter-like MFS transporter